MFATLIETMNGYQLRSSFFQTKNEAVEYAERMPGIIAIEEIGGDVVWQRPGTYTD